MRDSRLVKPMALRPGDRVAVVAPSSAFPREDFFAGLDELRRLGFEPVFDERVFGHHRYTAGEPVSRARAFAEAWQDPGVRAVLAARGGYGSAGLLPWLSLEALARTPKILVGFSDVTALLSVLTTRCGMTAVHGPVVAGGLAAGPGRYDRHTFLQSLTSGEPLGALAAPALEALAEGDAEGPIVGGNLTQVAASMGTPYAFDPPEGCVLFLEDVNERPYRLDRLLTQLSHAGILHRARAVVFGEMPGCDEPDGSVAAKDAIGEVLRGFSGPVLLGLPAGHTAGPALTLPLGVRARVATRPSPVVEILESAVRDGPGPRVPGPDSRK
ncbi:MAG TPA: LD-carboxypeptidase [Vicinamibacterales bacterium]|nr:LD-carboxypeptidase [Vicinamibacterales bacterium]HPW20882.1 LD-carboxypeptidase [Vicinamibacterales bacterium]